MERFALEPNHGRQLLSVFDNQTIKIVIIVVCSVVGALLLALALWLCITKCGRKKSAQVVPEWQTAAPKVNDVEKGLSQQAGNGTAPAAAAAVTPPAQEVIAEAKPTPEATAAAAAAAVEPPVPPLVSVPARLPPGITLAPITPPMYNPILSNPRLATDPPYERLVLISSRVHNADAVARAVLPNVAYIVYDWKNFTLQELLLYVRKVLGPQKVTSIAVVAPGSTPGRVGLLEGASTTPEELATKTELSQFWRVLAGCVALSGTADGRRVDLIGCRVVEAPREGAALLKELWSLTTVPFTAADDALGGYMLCTFMEEPVTKQLSLIACSIPAIDLYFNRHALLAVAGAPAGAQPARVGTGPAVSGPPLPPGPPPVSALTPIGPAPLPQQQQQQPPVPLPVPVPTPSPTPTPDFSAQQPPPPPHFLSAPLPPPPPVPLPVPVPFPAPTPTPDPNAQQPPAPPNTLPAPLPLPAPSFPPPAPPNPTPAALPQDVFTRLDTALRRAGVSPEAAFREYDRDGNGKLSSEELAVLLQKYLPEGASEMDRKHFMAMLDQDAVEAQTRVDGKEVYLLSEKEFKEGLPENVDLQRAVREREDDDVLQRLRDYLTDNRSLMEDVFKEFDKDASGYLDHRELGNLVATIPGLEVRERKYIVVYLYQHDANRDNRLNIDELFKALDEIAKTPSTVARSVSQQGAGPQAVAGVAAAGAAAAAAGFQAPAGQAAHAAAVQGQALWGQGQEAMAPGQAALGQAQGMAGQAQTSVQDAADRAAQSAQERAAAAAMGSLPPPSFGTPLAPLGPPVGQLAPLGAGRLAPMEPLAPRPGALAPLQPLLGR